MEEEIWKDIEGYEGYYQISDKGRVRSLDITITDINGVVKSIKGKILTPQLNRGYYRIALRKNSKTKHFFIHRLLFQYFKGELINGYCIDHINNIKLDNNLDNLQQITNRENSSKDRWRKGKTSKFSGIHLSSKKNRWRSTININGKTKHIGYFLTEEEASESYKQALRNLTNNQDTSLST